MKTFAAIIVFSLSTLSTSSFASSWEFDGQSKIGGERCQCTWSFDK